MDLLWYYLYLSLVMPIPILMYSYLTLDDFWENAGRDDALADHDEKFLEKYVASGDIQKEVYPDGRVVHHPKNDNGRIAIASNDAGNVFLKSKTIHLVVSYVLMVFVWPFELYALAKDFLKVGE